MTADETQTTNNDTAPDDTETSEEREKRARKSAPMRLFIGSDDEGWKPAQTPPFADEREARRWMRDNGADGRSYKVLRDYGTFRVVPRRIEELG